MPDEITPPVVTGKAPTEVKPVTVEQLQEQIVNLTKMQSGSDRAYQDTKTKLDELVKENEALKKDRMSEAERTKFELEKKEQDLTQKEEKINASELKIEKLKLIGEKKLSPEWDDFISVKKIEEIGPKLDTLFALIEKEVNARVEIRLKGGPRPSGGGTPPADHNEALRAAFRAKKGL